MASNAMRIPRGFLWLATLIILASGADGEDVISDTKKAVKEEADAEQKRGEEGQEQEEYVEVEETEPERTRRITTTTMTVEPSTMRKGRKHVEVGK